MREVDGIFQFFGRRLVGMKQAFRVGFEIHLDLTFADDVAGLRIVLKIGAVDLVEAGGIASVQRDRDIMQLGTPTLLELHCFAGLNFEQGVALFGAGDGETLRALLHLQTDFPGNFLQRILRLVAGVEIHCRHYQQKPDGACRKPATKAGNGKRHLKTV